MGLTLINPATDLPVTLASLKAWVGVEDSSFDAVLAAQLSAACSYVGRQLGRSLGFATWRLTLDGFSDAIELQQGPVNSIITDGFTYVDTAGVGQVVDPALYSLDLTTDPQWVVRNSGETWPELLDAVSTVWLTFTAGWTEETLPSDLAAAVCLIAANWFENRGAVNVGNITSKMPFGVYELLWPHRRIRI